MEHFVRVIMEKQEEPKRLAESVFPQYEIGESELDTTVYNIPLDRDLSINEADEYANRLANYLFSEGFDDFDIEITSDNVEPTNEITYDDVEEFHEDFGILGYIEDDAVWEAEYQGRTVKLNKPMAGDVKKFKVYVKNPKGNVIKVNFGSKEHRIKKDNPDARRSFRARHNCENPGPKHKARYWSCRKW